VNGALPVFCCHLPRDGFRTSTPILSRAGRARVNASDKWGAEFVGALANSDIKVDLAGTSAGREKFSPRLVGLVIFAAKSLHQPRPLPFCPSGILPIQSVRAEIYDGKAAPIVGGNLQHVAKERIRHSHFREVRPNTFCHLVILRSCLIWRQVCEQLFIEAGPMNDDGAPFGGPMDACGENQNARAGAGRMLVYASPEIRTPDCLAYSHGRQDGTAARIQLHFRPSVSLNDFLQSTVVYQRSKLGRHSVVYYSGHRNVRTSVVESLYLHIGGSRSCGENKRDRQNGAHKRVY